MSTAETRNPRDTTMTEDGETFTLCSENAVEYLRERDVVPADTSAEASSLGGGVSNTVIRVQWRDGCLVAKQPLPNLAVEDDWPADVARVHNEAAAARAYERILARADVDRGWVPEVAFENENDHVVAVACAPADATMWKHELLGGRVDPDVARITGAILGTVHAEAAGDTALRAQFTNKRPFDQLRVDPYHRTTAKRHPEVREPILAEAERTMNQDRTLVHGDYSPKNVLVDRTRDTPEAWMLDFEVAHWGDPAFDTAFMLNHLFIKSLYVADRHEACADAARTFWSTYDERVSWDVERETVAELGVLMLARVDGKSPVEYVTEEATKDALRTVAKRALAADVVTIEGFADAAGNAVAEYGLVSGGER